MSNLRKYLGDVAAVRPGHEIDADALLAYLEREVRTFSGPIKIRQFAGGQSNPTYLIETPEKKYVLRRKPYGPLLPSAHQIDREYRVMDALGAAGFPVPDVLCYCADEDVIGAPFYVMAHIEGRIFSDCRMPDLTREDRAAAYDSANATLARLHSFDLKALGLEDYGRTGNYFGRQIARWSRQYQASCTDDILEMEKLIEWLPNAVPPGDDTGLIHGDYSFHNLLFHPVRPEVLGVLDWELSTTGHPVGDLMYHGMEWYRPVGSDPRGTLADADLPALGIPTLEEYVARYCARAGRAPIAELGFYRAYNLFRVAAIVQGIVARARDGTAASAEAADQAPRVRALATAAWREARELGAS